MARPVHQANPPRWFFSGNPVTLRLTGEQTGGAFCLAEFVLAPGYATPPHCHTRDDEAVHLLDGELEVTIGDRRFTLHRGETAFTPRGVPHRLHNATFRPVRAMVVGTPAGFDGFIRATGTPALPGMMPVPADVPRMIAEAPRFGMTFGA